MTLLETLVTVGLLALVIMGSLHFVSLIGKGLSHTSQNDSISHTMAHLNSAFGNDDRYCTSILGGTVLNPADSSGTQIQSIHYYDLQGTKLSSVVTLNQPADSNPSLLVSDIRLKPVSVLSSQSVFANLEIRFSILGKDSAGLGTRTRQIAVYAVTRNGRVLTCSTSPFGKKVINNRVCQMRNDGYAHFDPVSQTCQDNTNVKWFYGTTPFTATCGSGYKPAVSPLNPQPGKMVCAAEISGGVTLPPRQYSGGFTDSSLVNTWVAKVDSPVTTCSFVYPSDVDPTNYRAKIKCVLQ